jgi:hypothetical protein
VVVIQALVIVFIAAPAIVSGIFHIRTKASSAFELTAREWGG